MLRNAFVILLILMAGCDSHKVLSGQWLAEDPMPLTYFEPDGNVSTPVYVELTLGHYGNEVVGIARYYTKAIALPENLRQCDDTMMSLACQCTEVSGDYHLDKERFRFYLDPYCSGNTKLVELVLDDDDLLVWKLDNAGSKEIEFRRVLEEKALTKSHKTCAPCE